MTQTTPPPATTTTTPKPRSRTVLYAIIIIILIVVGVGVYYLTRGPTTSANIIVNDDGTCAPGASACNFTPLTYNTTVNTPATWQNSGRVGHTITSCDSSQSPAPTATECPTMNAAGLDNFNKAIGSGASVSFAVTKAGTYFYYCSIHPSMHGILGAK